MNRRVSIAVSGVLLFAVGAAVLWADDAPTLDPMASYNIALNKSYRIEPRPAASYPDKDGKQLTDGSAQFSWADMVGFEAPQQDPTVIIDLGKLYEDIGMVAVKLMYSAASGVQLPKGILVSVSEDGELFDEIGGGTAYLEKEKTDTIMTLYADLSENPGYGRYVKVQVLPGGTAWTMLAEVIVTATGEQVPREEVSVSEKDLAPVSVGKSYMLTPEPSSSYPDKELKKVTDGSHKYSWGDMIGFDNPKSYPTVVIDLGSQQQVARVSGHFMRSFASAVNLPVTLVISVSNDGENFKTVGMANSWNPTPPKNEFINELYWLGNPVAARWVRVEIRPRGTAWTMLAEITISAVK